MKIRPLAFSLATVLGLASLTAALPARANSLLDTVVPFVDSFVGSPVGSPLDELAAQLGSPTGANVDRYAPIDIIPPYGSIANYPVDPQFVDGEDDENDGEFSEENSQNVHDFVTYGNGSSSNTPFDAGILRDAGSYAEQNSGDEQNDDQGGDSGQSGD